MRIQLFEASPEEGMSQAALVVQPESAGAVITPDAIVNWSRGTRERIGRRSPGMTQSLERKVTSLGADVSLLLAENEELRNSYMSILNAACEAAAAEVRLEFARVVLGLCLIAAATAVIFGFTMLAGKRLGFMLAIGGAILAYEAMLLFSSIGFRGRSKKCRN